MRFWIPVSVAVLFAGSMLDAQVIDGSLDMLYGAATRLQDTPTGFGDADGTTLGNEIDGIYGVPHLDGSLSLMVTGNINTDYTGLVIFIDSKAGGAITNGLGAMVLGDGSGQLGSLGGGKTDDWGTDTDGGFGVSPTPGGGSILDPGFDPDFSLEINADAGGYYFNVIDMTVPNEPGLEGDVYLGQFPLDGTANTSTYSRLFPVIYDADITHAFNNSNTAGVLGYDFGNPPGPLGDPTTATTGLELLLSTEFLGGGVVRDTGRDILVMPFITGTSGDFMSNQMLPGLGGVENLGNPGGLGGTPLFDSREFAGNNYVVYTLNESVDGDFDNNGLWNCDDINALSAAIAGGSTDLSFDMNGDGFITAADITDANTGWLAVGGANNVAQTGGNPFLNGDANLSGDVDGSDFGNWNANKFTSNSAWCSGDFDASGGVDGSDFGIWNGNKFQSSASASAVPEPATVFMMLGGLLTLAVRRRV